MTPTALRALRSSNTTKVGALFDDNLRECFPSIVTAVCGVRCMLPVASINVS